jgi:phosphate transport system protein
MELEKLKELILKMAGHADASVKKSVSALLHRREDLAEQVQISDNTIDQLEVEIDLVAHRILAASPEGRDLRFVTSAMKISLDLERVGDEATTIARRSQMLLDDPPMVLGTEIESMAATVLEMLKEATESFIFRDPGRARRMIARDKQVDAANRRIQQYLKDQVRQSPASLDPAINMIFISRSLERIGDHAKNIGESVVFLQEAVDIRHSSNVVH